MHYSPLRRRVRRERNNKISVKRIRHGELSLFVDSPNGCIRLELIYYYKCTLRTRRASAMLSTGLCGVNVHA
jgi:hypothetical protein